MKTSLPDFDKARVLVVGDVMLDRYMTGGTHRISPEAPVPIVAVSETEDRPGGAANVAVSISALGGSAFLIGLSGDDEASATLARQLCDHAVKADLIRLPTVATVLKLRVLSHGQQLIRLDFEHGFRDLDVSALLEPLAARLSAVNTLVLSDYNKGTLADAQGLIRLAKKAGVFVLVDPKGFDFGKYRGADLVTPNMAEFEAVAGRCRSDEDLVARARKLMQQYQFGSVLVTRSEKGMTLISTDKPEVHLPTSAISVSDVTGAGDTVISTLATALSAEVPLPEACRLANIAAGIVVTKVGTSTVNRAELASAMAAHDLTAHSVLDKGELALVVDDAKRRGEKIVMTNGCFDILHAGHVAYLNSAAQLGDRLIVAVNSDQSVAKLKGKKRPINLCQDRMKVLASLAAVDWVIEFSEDTPEDLIAALLPDVLVKGGDYRVEEIAGHKQVLDNGGEVRILQFEEGYSSSAIIQAIRK